MSQVKRTIRPTLLVNTIRQTLRGYGSGGGTSPGIPAGALIDRDGNPILDADGNYIIVGHG